jgi:hypothetical protein
MLRQLCVLGLVALFWPFYALSQLGTPVGEKPSGPAPKWTEFRWSPVPGADHYMLRVWTTDYLFCSWEDARYTTPNTSAQYSPYILVLPAYLCNESECGFFQKGVSTVATVTHRVYPAVYADPIAFPAARAEVAKSGGNANAVAHSTEGLVPLHSFSRTCNGGVQPPQPPQNNLPIKKWNYPRTGPLIEWRWTIQALAGWNATTKTWAKEGAQSNPVMYYLEEAPPKQPPTPTPTPEPKPHPITFINQSGMSLYIYYFFGGTVGCKDFRNGGTMADGQSSQQFIIPAKSSAQFVFQKSPDPCTFDQQFTTRNSRGGNPVAETMVISR